MLAREGDQRDDLVVVHAAFDDRVELDGREPRRLGGEQAVHDLVEVAAAGDAPEAVGVEAVEADVEAAQTGRLEGRGLVGQRRGVGGQADVAQPVDGGQPRNQVLQTAAGERLAARQPDFFHSQPHEQAGQAGDFLEREHLALVQPVVLVQRHAIGAAVVAAVGDRNTQILDRPPEPVTHATRLFLSHRLASYSILPVEPRRRFNPLSPGGRGLGRGGRGRNLRSNKAASAEGASFSYSSSLTHFEWVAQSLHEQAPRATVFFSSGWRR